MTPAADLHEFKERVRATWSLGDYQRVADRQLSIAAALCDWTSVVPHEQVLDVGTATGNVALTAAGRGAAVTALDITPRMLDLARGRATEQGLVIEFVEGDLEDLPFPDVQFDAALSACGMWFAPRPALAVQELHRVLRPGGRLGLANFTPGGYMGRVNEIVKRRLPLPDGVPEPNGWGREEVARQRLAAHFEDVECRTATLRYTFPSAPAATEFFAAYSPPHVAAAHALDADAAKAMLSEIERHTADETASSDGIVIDAEYLLVRGRAR